MPIGNGSGQSFGLKGKVDVSPEKRSLSRLEKDVERTLGKAEQSFGRGLNGHGFKSRTMGMGGGRRGPGIGGATALGSRGSGLLSRLGGTASKALPVALAGTVAFGMLREMSKASGYMRASSSVLGQAWSLAWKPFGDALGKTILPWAKEALDMAVQFNKMSSEKGLGVAVKEFPKDVFDLEIGGIDLFDFSWDAYIDTMKWTKFVPSLTWPVFIGNLAWDIFVDGLDWDFFVDALAWDFFVTVLAWDAWIDGLFWDDFLDVLGWDDFVPRIDWSDFIPKVNWKLPEWLGEQTTTTTTDTPTETGETILPSGRVDRSGIPGSGDPDAAPIWAGGVGAGGVDFSGGTSDPTGTRDGTATWNPTFELNGRRIGEEILTEANQFLRSL